MVFGTYATFIITSTAEQCACAYRQALIVRSRIACPHIAACRQALIVRSRIACLHIVAPLLLLLPQVLLSFMPDLESAWLCSMLGAAMSLGYSFIALGLGAAQVRFCTCSSS